MNITTALGCSDADAARIRKEIQSIARSSKTLEEALAVMGEKYDTESMIAGFLFYALVFEQPSPSLIQKPSLN